MISSLLQKIPLVVVGILLIIAVMKIYFRSKNVTKTEFFKIFKKARYFEVWILVFVVVITGVFAIFNYIKSKETFPSLYICITFLRRNS